MAGDKTQKQMSVGKPFPRSYIVDEHPAHQRRAAIARNELFSHPIRQIFFGLFFLLGDVVATSLSRLVWAHRLLGDAGK